MRENKVNSDVFFKNVPDSNPGSEILLKLNPNPDSNPKLMLKLDPNPEPKLKLKLAPNPDPKKTFGSTTMLFIVLPNDRFFKLNTIYVTCPVVKLVKKKTWSADVDRFHEV